MSEESFKEVLARSSLGGSAWCSTCDHPDLNHLNGRRCVASDFIKGDCICKEFVPMTADEWLRRRAR